MELSWFIFMYGRNFVDFMSSVKDQIAAELHVLDQLIFQRSLWSRLALKMGFEFWSGCKCFNMGLSHLIWATLKLVPNQNKFFWAQKFVPPVHRPVTWRQISTCQQSWHGTCDYHLSCRTLYVSFAFLGLSPKSPTVKETQSQFCIAILLYGLRWGSLQPRAEHPLASAKQ